MTTYQRSIEWQALSVELLNDVFTPLAAEDRIRLLYRYFKQDEVLFTSSFGVTSVLMLHLIHRLRPSQPVHFIDTTYHFPETLAYRDELARRWNLTVIDVRPRPEENALTREEQWWAEHPRMCCTINKVAPLEPIKAAHKVWISGLMAYQTPFRSRLQIFEKQGDIIKFHPLIDFTEEQVGRYRETYDLPKHPLEDKGYGSVGCTHCTVRGAGREGRWQKSGKTECGLHPGYFVKRKKR